MRQDRPEIDNLLHSIQQFVESIVPRLDAEDRYRAQVSAYLLGICRRELAAGEASTDTAEPDALADFCRDIRAGRYDQRWDAALDRAMEQVVDKVKVVRPEYLAPDHREPGAGAS